MHKKVVGVFKKKRTSTGTVKFRDCLILKLNDAQKDTETLLGFNEAASKYPQEVIDFLVERITIKGSRHSKKKTLEEALMTAVKTKGAKTE